MCSEFMMMDDLEDSFLDVERPGRYVGNEINARNKSFDDSSTRFALAFPDVYEVGLSHIGLQVLYHTLNGVEGAMADRVYTPWPDMENLLRSRGEPLRGIESGRPLGEFDFLGVSLQYELSYTNILTVLDLAGIPFLAKDRSKGHPWVIAGGPCAFNPEPIAELFDLIVLGEAEELLPELVALHREWKAGGGSRRDFLDAARKIEGIYVPAFFDIEYQEDGRIVAICPLIPDYTTVRKRIVKDLDAASPLAVNPLTPMLEIVHDRLSLEIARGCTRGCRFCQASFIYRPVRERAPEEVFEKSCKALANSGFEEMSLLSLSTGDYHHVQALLTALMQRCEPLKVAVSFPSMRVGTLTPELMELVRKVRKTGFTVAPEAATERLRGVINKGIRDEDLLSTVENAYRMGWRVIKLYFMLGLPTETREDLDAIIERCIQVWQRGKKSKAAVNASVSTFVPKAMTPFQWFGQIPRKEIEERLAFLKDGFKRPGLRLKWGLPAQSVLEAVFARGDRRLLKTVMRAWELGARYDAWTDGFKEDVWTRAFEETGLRPEDYAERTYTRDDVLPWDHLSAGVDKDFLWREYENALAGKFTPDCRWEACSNCGVCDHREIKPLLHREPVNFPLAPVGEESQADEKEEPLFLYHLWYSKTGKARFFGQIEITGGFTRAVRRAGFPAAFSKGFHPHLKMSFVGALPLGVESLVEEAYLTLTARVDADELLSELNRRLPEGLKILEASLAPRMLGRSPFQRVTYRVSRLTAREVAGILRSVPDRLDDVIVKRTKRKEIKVSIRKVLSDLRQMNETSIEIDLYEGPEVCIRPMAVLNQLLEGSSERLSGCRICKVAVEPVEETDNVHRTDNQRQLL